MLNNDIVMLCFIFSIFHDSLVSLVLSRKHYIFFSKFSDIELLIIFMVASLWKKQWFTSSVRVEQFWNKREELLSTEPQQTLQNKCSVHIF